MAKLQSEKIESAAADHIQQHAGILEKNLLSGGYRPRYRGAEEFAELYQELDPLVVKEHMLRQEQLMRIIHSTVSQDADENDFETEEEANDFEWPEVNEFATTHTLPVVEEQLATEHENDLQLQEAARAAQKNAKSTPSPSATPETLESSKPQVTPSKGLLDE